MRVDRLWAPWRLAYVRTRKQKGCIFCAARKSPASSRVFMQSKHSIAMLNIFPYNNGHIMISPKRHIKDLSQLNEFELLDLFGTLNKARELLHKVLRPDGYNIGINISRAAGAGITGHLHIHVVPRWVGDTNFMPILSDAKVISQSLDDLYKKLCPC